MSSFFFKWIYFRNVYRKLHSCKIASFRKVYIAYKKYIRPVLLNFRPLFFSFSSHKEKKSLWCIILKKTTQNKRPWATSLIWVTLIICEFFILYKCFASSFFSNWIYLINVYRKVHSCKIASLRKVYIYCIQKKYSPRFIFAPLS